MMLLRRCGVERRPSLLHPRLSLSRHWCVRHGSSVGGPSSSSSARLGGFSAGGDSGGDLPHHHFSIDDEDEVEQRVLTPPRPPRDSSARHRRRRSGRRSDVDDPNALYSFDHPDDSFQFVVRPKYFSKEVWSDVHDPPYPVFDVNDDKTFLPEVLGKKNGYTKFALLNRPKQLHALNLNMVETLIPIWKKWESHKRTSELIVLSSSTNEEFSCGTDYREILQMVQTGRKDHAKKYFAKLYELAYTIFTSNTMVLPIMNGVTMGSAAALCFSSRSFCAATETAQFAMPETKIGFFPDTGSSHFLSHVGKHGALGMYLALTGKRLHGHDIKNSGIATHLITRANLDYLFRRLDLGQYDLDQTMWTLQETESNEDIPLTFEHRGILSKIESIFSRDSVADIIRGLEEDGSDWASKTLASLRKSSPLSLLVTHRALKEGRDAHITKCLAMEYRLVDRMLESADFAEGVTARIVERREPKWTTSLDMPNSAVDELFAPSLDGDELVLPMHGALTNYARELRQFRGYNSVRENIHVTRAGLESLKGHATLQMMRQMVKDEKFDDGGMNEFDQDGEGDNEIEMAGTPD